MFQCVNVPKIPIYQNSKILKAGKEPEDDTQIRKAP